MSISRGDSDDDGTVTIKVSGRFNHHVHDAFREAFADYPKGEKAYVVDLAETATIDSSALCLLLQLKAHNRPDCRVRLRHASPAVRTALVKAGYTSLFAFV